MTSNNEKEPLLKSSTSVNSNRNSQVTISNLFSSRDLSGSTLLLFPPTRKYLIPGVIILFVVLFERIAFYSLTGNLFLFLNQTEFGWRPYNAIMALLIFNGISYLSSLIGGWISDSTLGRYKTITIAFVLFTFAYWFLPFLSDFCPLEKRLTNSTNGSTPVPRIEIPIYEENCFSVIMAILVLAAIGTGTVKANITPFGAEQVRYSGPRGLRIYLNWLYWFVNIGAFIGILGIAYVQQGINFYIGYLVPASLVSFAAVLFILSYSLYVTQSPTGSAISKTFAIIKEAWKSNRLHNQRQRSEEQPGLSNVSMPSWLDMAKVTYGGKFHESAVEDVKSLPTIIIVFLALIPYWILYFQMQTTFLAQGLHLKLKLFHEDNATKCDIKKNEFYIPAAWLMLFNVFFLILFIPLMNYIIYPFLDKRNIQPSMLTRMIIGMICASSSMFIAGGLETYRLQLVAKNETVCQVIEATRYIAADLSIFWQIPQYSLIGISEVFTSVTGMEFACSQAPSSMQGAIMGFFYFCAGIGSFLGVIALKVFEDIDKISIKDHFNDINLSHMNYYYFFLATMQFIALIIFTFISRKLKIRKPPAPLSSRTILPGNASRSS